MPGPCIPLGQAQTLHVTPTQSHQVPLMRPSSCTIIIKYIISGTTHQHCHFDNIHCFENSAQGLREIDLPIEQAEQHCKCSAGLSSVEVIDQADANKSRQVMDVGAFTHCIYQCSHTNVRSKFHNFSLQ